MLFFFNSISFKVGMLLHTVDTNTSVQFLLNLAFMYLLKSNFSSLRYEEEKFRKKQKRYIPILIRVASR